MVSDPDGAASAFEMRWARRQGVLSPSPSLIEVEQPLSRAEIASAEAAVARVVAALMTDPDADPLPLWRNVMDLPPRPRRAAWESLQDAHAMYRQRAALDASS